MSIKKVNHIKSEAIIISVAIVILFLTAVNIATYSKPKTIEVLGAETETNTEEFWKEFLSKNPNYIPGWIEIGQTDKALKIDPNYDLKTK